MNNKQVGNIYWLEIYLEQNDIKITLFHFNSHLTQKKYEDKQYSRPNSNT